MRLSILFILISLCLPLCAFAADDPPPTILEATAVNLASYPNWNKLKIPAGTKIIITRDDAGKKISVLKFTGGVVISEEGVQTDTSGKGAVQCVWQIYSEVHDQLEICDPNNTKLRIFINTSLDRINAFIVANSLINQSKTDLDHMIETKLAETRIKAAKMSPEDMDKFCKTGLLASTEKVSESTLQSQIDTMLSVPRPPVLNPCQ